MENGIGGRLKRTKTVRPPLRSGPQSQLVISAGRALPSRRRGSGSRSWDRSWTGMMCTNHGDQISIPRHRGESRVLTNGGSRVQTARGGSFRSTRQPMRTPRVSAPP